MATPRRRSRPRSGADVTLIERDIIGGAAHLWDCIPSKAMIATGGELSELTRARAMGLVAEGHLDVDALRERVASIEDHLQASVRTLLESQGVRLIEGRGRLQGPREVIAETEAGAEQLDADFVVLATGSRPRIPDWAVVDGERILTTRQAYPPKEIPEHLCVIGSGVTGVEFTHMFSALGSQVSLVVSRQQVLPLKDAEVAAVLEDEFLARGVRLLKGARAKSVDAGRRLGARRVRRRAQREGVARRPRDRIDPEPRAPRAGGGRRRDRRRRLRQGQPQLPVERRATSTRPGTSPGSCRSRRSRRCRGARSPST